MKTKLTKVQVGGQF